MKQVKPVYETIKSITGFQTSDNKIFDNIEKAKEHQEYLNYKEEIYNVFDEILDDYLTENDVPFNYGPFETIIKFIVANMNLKSFIEELQRIDDKYSFKEEE